MEVDKFLVISCEALNTAILEVNCALAFQELKNFFSLFLFFFIPLFLFTVLLKPVSLGFYHCTQKIPRGQNGMAWSCPFQPVTTFPLFLHSSHTGFLSVTQKLLVPLCHNCCVCSMDPAGNTLVLSLSS